jgi:endonuclease YncB( thermonuclease family)
MIAAIRFLLLAHFLVLAIGCGSSSNESGSNAANISSQLRNNTVVKIVDGDTYDVILDGTQTRIRMEGIDTPERGMDYYKVAKDYLGKLCVNQKVRVVGSEKDRYGRLLAKTYLSDGRELGVEMVRAGMAWHYKKYSSDPTLAKLERQARAAHIGLWSLANPTPPWEFRHAKRKE